MKRILLFGSTGQVGWELHRSLQPLGQVRAANRGEADFSEPETLRGLIREYQPHVIVNAAAYTDVDMAERDFSVAHCINARAPHVIADEAARLGALVVHYSSDYVFDGTKEQPYSEEDEPNPLNVYGESKIAGDRAIQSSGCRYIILRTSWIYSSHRSNFLLKILNLAEKQEELRVVTDQVGTPTSARLIAAATACCLYRVIKDSDIYPNLLGLFNLTAGGSTSRFGFANEIINGVQATQKNCHKRCVPVSAQSETVPAVALRPKNAQLNCRRFIQAFDLTLPDWRQDLTLNLGELLSRRGSGS